MDTQNERELIEEIFTLAFVSSMQVDAPGQHVLEAFTSYVIARTRSEGVEFTSPSVRGYKVIKGERQEITSTELADHRYIYACIPEFINQLCRKEA